MCRSLGPFLVITTLLSWTSLVLHSLVLTLAWALYALRMQRDEERVKSIEGCSGLPAVGLAAPHRGLRVERRAAGQGHPREGCLARRPFLKAFSKLYFIYLFNIREQFPLQP